MMYDASRPCLLRIVPCQHLHNPEISAAGANAPVPARGIRVFGGQILPDWRLAAQQAEALAECVPSHIKYPRLVVTQWSVRRAGYLMCA